MYVVVMIIWILSFLTALSHYGTAWAVGQWYFHTTDPVSPRRPFGDVLRCCDITSTLRGVSSGLLNHPGSLAAGSFIVTLCKCVKILFFWVKKNDQVAGNPVTHVIRMIVNCLAKCITDYIEWISEHAFVEVALRGQGFCVSTMRALSMSCARPALFGLVNHVSLGLVIVGMLVVTSGTTLLTSLFLYMSPPAGLDSPRAPLIVAALAGLVVGEIVMHPVVAAARAALHCYILDEEQTEEHTGSRGTRYAPKTLGDFASAQETGSSAEVTLA